MPTYGYKDDVALAFEENKRRLRLEANLVASRIANEALDQMTKQFNAALSRGEILSIGGTREEMRGYLATAAAKELGVGDGTI